MGYVARRAGGGGFYKPGGGGRRRIHPTRIPAEGGLPSSRAPPAAVSGGLRRGGILRRAAPLGRVTVLGEPAKVFISPPSESCCFEISASTGWPGTLRLRGSGGVEVVCGGKLLPARREGAPWLPCVAVFCARFASVIPSLGEEASVVGE